MYGAFGKPIAEWEYDIVLGAIFGLGAVGPLKRAYPVTNSSDTRAVASEVATHGIFTWCAGRARGAGDPRVSALTCATRHAP